MSLSCACRATGCRMAARRWHRPHTASASKWRGYQVRAKSLKILVRLCTVVVVTARRAAPRRVAMDFMSSLTIDDAEVRPPRSARARIAKRRRSRNSKVALFGALPGAFAASLCWCRACALEGTFSHRSPLRLALPLPERSHAFPREARPSKQRAAAFLLASFCAAPSPARLAASLRARSTSASAAGVSPPATRPLSLPPTPPRPPETYNSRLSKCGA